MNYQHTLNTAKRLLFALPAKIFIGLLLFYVLFSYFAINPLAKKLVPWIADNQLASEASVGKVTFDPLRLKLTVDDFRLREKTHAPLASVKQLVVDVEASGIFQWAWKFKEITLLEPKGLIAISPSGTLNWADLITKLNEDPSPPSDTIQRVVIAHIQVKQGNVQYADNHRTTPFKAELSPLNFELDGFSTLPKDRGDYLIAATFAEQGGTLKWKGDMGVNPVASKGRVAIDGVPLSKLLSIVKNTQWPFTANTGAIHTAFDYDFTLPQDKPKLVLTGVNLGLNQLNATVDNVGEVRAQSLNIKAPRLDLSSQTHLKVALQQLDVSLNAFSMHPNNASAITVNKLHATLPALDFSQQSQAQLAFEQLDVNLSAVDITHQQHTLLSVPEVSLQNIGLDLAKSQANIAQIMLDNGAVTANINKAGQLNWQAAFSSDKPSTHKTTTAEAPGNQATLSNTTPVEAPPPAFSVNIAKIALNNWQMKAKDDSFTNPLQFNIADINVNFAANNPAGDWEIRDLHTKLSQIALKSSLFNKPVATLQGLQLSQGDILLKPQQASVESVLLSGLKTELVYAPNAPLNWQRIFATSSSGAAQKPSRNQDKTSQPDWELALKKLALSDGQLHIEDQSPGSPVVLDIQKIALETRDASLDSRHAIPLKGSFSIVQGGRFEAQGKLSPAPLNVDMRLKADAVSFKPFAPYINQFALLKLNDGKANLNGRLTVKSQSPLAVNFNGGFSVDKLALVEEANNAPFLAWEQVASDSLAFSLAPNRLHIASLSIRQPVGKFIINPDKSTNIARILRSQAGAAAAPAVVTVPVSAKPALPIANSDLARPKLPATVNNPEAVLTPAAPETNEPEAFPVSIETVRIDNGIMEFADLSLTPQFGTNIHALSGVINGIATDANATAQVELDGKVDDYGAAKVRGSVKPFKATQFTDLKLSFTNLEMSRLTPYSGKFAGRRIDSGKLSVDLEYKIKQRQLAGENKFIINKLKLGEKVDSADAADLPLDLAIAILEDSDGLIDLDLPITGSLDDPQFSYGGIVWKAIRNVLGKIVTAPFRALGKLFGGDGDKLEAIVFEAGSASMAPPELEKIKTISQALSKRQGLTLGIVPSYDQVMDVRALQETAIRRQVLAEMGVELAIEQAPGPIDLSNPKAQKAVDALHDTLTKKSLFKKLASKLEKPPAGHYEAALEKLITSFEIKNDDLLGLADSRGKAIQKALADAGISAERVGIANAVAVKGEAKTKVVATKLTIDVKSAPKQLEAKPSTQPAVAP